ncbi:MAG: hypothetical protein FD123_373 [Bacteroidetes bacterium]|nr:MAG: hypothetical protein FD123_373 [Bacteroidota bacterium]
MNTKTVFKHFLFSAVLPVVFLSQLQAQCTGCTSTITGTVSATQTVGAGQTLCIAPNSVLQGNLVINGGTVCNDGTIANASIVLNSGTITSAGLLSTTLFGISSGTFTSTGTAAVDSVDGLGANIHFNNYGVYTGTGLRLERANLSQSSTNLFFLNAGTMTLSGKLYLMEINATNTGSITTGNGFASMSQWVYAGSFTNDGPLQVTGMFENFDVFHTNCRVIVNGSWVNLGIVTGPSSSSAPCAGFSVSGWADNMMLFGQDGSYLDMCAAGGYFDAGPPPGSNITLCQCNSVCTVTTSTGSISAEEIAAGVFPNPVQDQLNVEVSQTVAGSVMVYAIDGRIVYAGDYKGLSKLTIDTSHWDAGIYQLVITAGDQVFIRKIIRN